jgi:uncharacterized membrane protein YgdD (TMEM256/DUF423 family)
MNPTRLIQVGAIVGALSVALGAFGAHALKPMLLATDRLDTFETAVKYQFYHALALLFLGLLMPKIQPAGLRYIRWSGLALLIGTVIFSGSLYVICFTGVTAFGAIAPLGGSSLIVGWVFLFWGAKYLNT